LNYKTFASEELVDTFLLSVGQVGQWCRFGRDGQDT